MPLVDHVYYVGIVSKNLTSFAMTWACIQGVFLNSFVILFVEFSFWDNVSCNINHTIRISWYQRIHMPKYFFPNKLFVFLVFRSFSKIRIFIFYPKILSCVEINLFEFRSQVKIPHVTDFGKFHNTAWFVYQDICLFVLRLNVPVNNFSVMSGRSHRFLGN